MRYTLFLFFITVMSSLYSAQPNMHTALTLAALDQQHATTPAYSIESCTLMTLPSEHCLRTFGAGLLAATAFGGVFFGYPAPHPGNILLCATGCCGVCMLGSSKLCAKKKCIIYYCCPNFCKERQLPEIPTVPEPISIEPELATVTPQVDEQL